MERRATIRTEPFAHTWYDPRRLSQNVDARAVHRCYRHIDWVVRGFPGFGRLSKWSYKKQQSKWLVSQVGAR